MSVSQRGFNEPLSPLDAYGALREYGLQNGVVRLKLLAHCAVPEQVRPDLVNLVKINFIPESGTDLSVDADVLFSPILEPIGTDFYRMEPEIRRQCLLFLDAAYRWEEDRRTSQVARLVLRYLEQLEAETEARRDLVFAEFIDVQRWSAWAFIDPSQTANEMEQSLASQATFGGGTRFRLGALTAALSIPLAGHQQLLAYARGLDAIEHGNIGVAREMVEELGRQSNAVEDTKQRQLRALIAERADPEETPSTVSPEREQQRVISSRSDPPLTVFVCATFDDLEEERERALDAIRRLQLRYNALEYFGARPERPIEVCLEEVRNSDLLVVIVGQKYGSLPPGMGVSYSEAEYEEGVRLEKPCLVYLRDDDVPILPRDVESNAKKRKLLKAWKARLRSRHTTAKFADRDDLALQIASDLGRFIAEQRIGLVVAEAAKAKNLPERTLREVLKRLGETDMAEAEIPERLARAADEIIRLRSDFARLSNDRPEFAAIRGRAGALIDRGEFDAARTVLDEGRVAAHAPREGAARTEAQFLADMARIDLLLLNYDSACAEFAEAAPLDQDNVPLWIELGEVWITRGSLDQAGKAFFGARDAALRSENDSELARAYVRIGGVQIAQGDLAGGPGLLPRQPCHPRPVSESRPRQRWLAA